MTPPILEVHNLHISFKTYLGKIKAVQGLSFSLEEGETLAIVGESGCGKSATAQSIMQLIPSPPGSIDKGSIRFKGKELLTKSNKEMNAIRGSEIGMIFQDPMTSLNPTMRVGHQIMEPLIKKINFSKDKAQKRSMELMTLVGITHPTKRFHQYPHEFSGGMRQRVMIAIALACSPKILIADEPTTALDVTIQSQILDLMQELQKKTKTSIILITHDLGIVARMCDRILVMYAGNIIESGTAEEIFYHPKHPYTQGLLDSIPTLASKTKRLIPIPGSPPDLLHLQKGCSFAPRCPKVMHCCTQSTPPSIKHSPSHNFTCWLGDNRCKNYQENHGSTHTN